jgi:hypothetical protein
LLGQLLGTVATYFKAAALLRAVRGERRHDRRPARLDGALGQTNVVATIIIGGQEMEDGAAVPDVELADVFKGGRVPDDPIDKAGAAAQATLRHC